MTAVRHPGFALKTLFAATLACYAPAAWSNPAGATVVSGSASLQQQGNSLVVTNTPGAIINWQSFSINQNELTRFVQAGSNSAVLNRVTGQEPSQILGQLQSNGRVFLINPNGIVFGQGAQVDVAGLLASTLNISDEDFRAGKLRFAGQQAGSLSNAASITTPSGGFVYLIAPNIENNGVVVSPKGEILLAAGASVELVDGVDTSLRVRIDAPAGEAVNVGQLIAEQGRIGVFAAAIRQQGLVSADRAEVGEGGKIVFKASRDIGLAAASQTRAHGGEVLIQAERQTSLAGALDVSNSEGLGGQAQVLGQAVQVEGNIDASGRDGGGTILLGGDYQGKNAAVANAQFTTLAGQASLNASATATGQGGKIIVWADKDTYSAGRISARGGALGGNGGFVEVSGKRGLAFASSVDLAAGQGRRGTLLLDPENLLISASCSVDCLATLPVNIGDGTSTTSTILASILNAATADIVLQASKDITFDANVATSKSISANAGQNLTVNSGLSSGGNISLTATNSLVINNGLSSAGFIQLVGNSITQTAGQINAGSTVVLNSGGNGITQMAGAGIITNRLDVNSAGNVQLLNANGSSGSLQLNALLNGSAGKVLSLNSNSALLLDQMLWAGPVNLTAANASIDQSATSSLIVDSLDLLTFGGSATPHGIHLANNSNQIKTLSARIDCAGSGCFDSLRVHSGRPLEIADAGVTNNTGADIELYALGDILLGSGQVAGHAVYLAADNGTIGYANSATTLGTIRGAMIDLQRLGSETSTGYAGTVGAATKPLQIATWHVPGDPATNTSTTLSIGNNQSGMVAGVHLVSSDDVYLASLGLAATGPLLLQTVRSIDIGSVGAINTTGDITLRAMGLNATGESLRFASPTKLSGTNVLLDSAGALVGNELLVNAANIAEFRAGSVSLQGSAPSAMAGIAAGNEVRLWTDALAINSNVQIAAPGVVINTLSMGTGLNLGGVDSSGVLGLDSAELSRISAANSLLLNVLGSGATLQVSTNYAHAGALNLHSNGGLTLGGDLSADKLSLRATQMGIEGSGKLTGSTEVLLHGWGGVGNAANPLRVAGPTITAMAGADGAGAIYLSAASASTFMANSVNSPIHIDSDAGMDITVSGVHAGMGKVDLLSGGNLLAANAMSSVSGGNLDLIAAGAVGSATQRFQANAQGQFKVVAGSGSSYVGEFDGASSHVFDTATGSIDAMLAGPVLLDEQTDLHGTGVLRLATGGSISIGGSTALNAGSLTLISGAAINSSRTLQALNGTVQMTAQSIGAADARVNVNAAMLQAGLTGAGPMHLASSGGKADLFSQGGMINLLADGSTVLNINSNNGEVVVATTTGAADLTGNVHAGLGMVSLSASGSLGLDASNRLQVDANFLQANGSSAFLSNLAGASSNRLNTTGGAIDLLAINGGQVTASSAGGPIKLQSSGQLHLAAIDAGGGDVFASAAKLQLAGPLNAAQVDLNASQDMLVSGVVTATGALTATADRLVNQGGVLQAAAMTLNAVSGIGGVGNTVHIETPELNASVSGAGAGLYLDSHGVMASLASNGGDIHLLSHSGSTMVATAASQGGAIVLTTQAGDLSAGNLQAGTGALHMDSAGDLSLGSSNSGAAGFRAAGHIVYDGAISAAGNSLSLDAGGKIYSNGGSLSGDTVNLRAVLGVGYFGPLAVNANTLNASATGAGGMVNVATQGGVANLHAADGTIELMSTGSSTVTANTGGVGNAVRLMSSAGDLTIQSLATSGAAQLEAMSGTLRGTTGSAWQAQQLQIDAGRFELNTDLHAGSILLASASSIDGLGGQLDAGEVMLRSVGSIGGAQAVVVNTAQLDAETTGSGAALLLSGNATMVSLRSAGGDIGFTSARATTLAVDAQGGRIAVSSGGALMGSFSGSAVKLQSMAGMGNASERVQIDAQSAELQAAGELFAEGGATLSSVKLSNAGAMTDFHGAASYSATVLAPSAAVVLHGGADIGLNGVAGNSVLVDAAGAIQGVGSNTQLSANAANLTAGGNIGVQQSAVSMLTLASGGAIDLSNSQPLNLAGAVAASDLRVESIGGLSTTGLVTAGGSVALITHSPLVIGAPGIEAGKDIRLLSSASASSSGQDDIVINGQLSTALGICDIQAGGSIQQNANIQTQGKAISLSAAGGNLHMGLEANTFSLGGEIGYHALGGMQLALLDADTGPVRLAAIQGGVVSVLPNSLNIRASALSASAGGGIFLRADVPADQLTLSSGTGLISVLDPGGVPYLGSTVGLEVLEQPISDTVDGVNLVTELGGSTEPSEEEQVQPAADDTQEAVPESGEGQEDDKRKKAKKC